MRGVPYAFHLKALLLLLLLIIIIIKNNNNKDFIFKEEAQLELHPILSWVLRI